ncbi:ABC-F family ATPase, partial [Burkholderia sp. SIMBA_057]
MEKIQLDEVKASSRVNPYIRFTQEKKLYRLARETENVRKSFEEEVVLKCLSTSIEVGEKVAIIGANGIGKTT